MSDLISMAFLTLTDRFFDKGGIPVPFTLRDKLNTQDDPFDEFLATEVFSGMEEITCVPSSGPLITPDIVLYRPALLKRVKGNEPITDTGRIVAIEVKKLERTKQGKVARASGLDYNTTPPSGQVRVYDAGGLPVDIRGFYLFVCLEPNQSSEFICTALALVDGNVLNEDFDLYLNITGEREKQIGLGTYGDGADRNRPMLIFANPLGVGEMDHAATTCAFRVEPGRNRPASTTRIPDRADCCERWGSSVLRLSHASPIYRRRRRYRTSRSIPNTRA